MTMIPRDEVQNVLDCFDDVKSERIMAIMVQIREKLKTDITKDYLDGKMQGIKDAATEDEKKNLCKTLIPYIEWYLQGN